MPKKKPPLRVPQTSLIDVQDALATVCSTVMLSTAALSSDEVLAPGEDAAQVLHAHVYTPIREQIEIIGQHGQVWARRGACEAQAPEEARTDRLAQGQETQA